MSTLYIFLAAVISMALISCDDHESAKRWLKGGNGDPAVSVEITVGGTKRSINDVGIVMRFNSVVASRIALTRGLAAQDTIGIARVRLRSGEEFEYTCYVSNKSFVLAEGNDDISSAVVATFLPVDCGPELFSALIGEQREDKK